MRLDLDRPTTVRLGPWVTGADGVREYLRAVQCAAQMYENAGIVPPTAIAARALREFFVSGSLPPGTIHAAQDLESVRPVTPAEELDCLVTLTPTAHGEQWETITADFAVRDRRGNAVLKGKTVVLVPKHVNEL